MTVLVGGFEITQDAIRREAQYHPAANFETACQEATQALVVRRLLLAEVERRGLASWGSGEPGEAEEQGSISELMDHVLEVPEVGAEACQAFFDAQPERFRGPDLFAPSHILIAATPTEELKRSEAKARALELLAEVKKRPERFERIARSSSGCPSGERGGNLGQVTRGETMPEFEEALLKLEPGELCPDIVETSHGYHILRLDDRAPGEAVPFESVRDRVMIYLRDSAWRKALQGFIQDLADKAQIEGFDFDANRATAREPSNEI